MEAPMFRSEISMAGVTRGLLLLVLVLIMGTLWFSLMEEDFTVVEALYMTVITVSTVGFKEVHELDPSGQIFVVVLIIISLSVLTYTLGHYLICGHGRMGDILCEELQREGAPFVVIEADPEQAELLIEKGYRVVLGDATEDAVLKKAGVTRAKGLVAVVSNNVNNLYITLSAREMCRQENPGLYILARATDNAACEKIRRAGADRVISPYAIGGMRIVQALLRPSVYDFVDVATQSSGLDLMFEQLVVGDRSGLGGVALKDSGIRSGYDVIVIAIKRPSGQMVFNPGPNVTLETGDELIVLGDRDQLKRLGQRLL
ncbi:potassium channel protein [bacterium DOLJORAL78_65_58]|nr:MAG: potassium channel protein [bacterium DOLJORAL78_65_58]